MWQAITVVILSIKFDVFLTVQEAWFQFLLTRQNQLEYREVTIFPFQTMHLY